jgi:hypothetical protein
MLEYTRIYSIFPYRAGAEVLQARQAGKAGGRTDNPTWNVLRIYAKVDTCHCTRTFKSR